MEKVLHNAIKQQIQALKDISFQFFIDELYLKLYGDEFVPIKQKQDRGNDGILHGDTILAVYAPEKYTLRAFKKKVEEDFNSYNKNLSGKYPKWQVIFNGEWTTEMVNFVKTLKDDSQIIGINHILELINNLKWSKLKEIADYLNVDNQFFINDILAKVIEDLLKDMRKKGMDATGNVPGKATYIEEKIELNYSREDIETAVGEYEDCLVFFTLIKDIIKGYEDEDKSALKNKIRLDYNRHYVLYKDFPNTLNQLTEIYCERHKNDDIYRFYVRVVLIYFFEQCLIGKKTEEEKNAAAAS